MLIYRRPVSSLSSAVELFSGRILVSGRRLVYVVGGRSTEPLREWTPADCMGSRHYVRCNNFYVMLNEFAT